MIKLAIKGDKRFKVLEIEKELAEKSRKANTTIQTVHTLKRLYPKQKFFWVIGSNLVKEVPKWHRFEQLIKEIRFIVVPIEGYEARAEWLEKNNAIVLKGKVARISSTEIREMIRQGIMPKKLLPEGVWDYIDRNMLYVSEFSKKVFSALRKIPRGRVSTYKDIAAVIGKPKAHRAVGNALNKNCFSSVPCHRVVKSDGSIGGFREGRTKKAFLLKKEGISLKNGRIVDFDAIRMHWKQLIL